MHQIDQSTIFIFESHSQDVRQETLTRHSSLPLCLFPSSYVVSSLSAVRHVRWWVDISLVMTGKAACNDAEIYKIDNSSSNALKLPVLRMLGAERMYGVKVKSKRNPQVKYRYLENLVKNSNKWFVLCFIPPMISCASYKSMILE